MSTAGGSIRSDKDVADNIRAYFGQLLVAIKEGKERGITTELWDGEKYVWELEGHESLSLEKVEKF